MFKDTFLSTFKRYLFFQNVYLIYHKVNEGAHPFKNFKNQYSI